MPLKFGDLSNTVSRTLREVAQFVISEKTIDSFGRVESTFPREILTDIESLQASLHPTGACTYVLNVSRGTCAMQLSMLNRDYAVRKLITMIAERDAAILERNSAIAERTAAHEERDAAFLLRDVAYADRDSAMEERDAAVAALEISVNNRTFVDRKSSVRDSKLFQTLSMKKNCTIVGSFHPAPYSSTRFGAVVQDESDLCKIGDAKETLNGFPRKRKLTAKSTLDRTVRAKRSCRSPQEHRLGLGDCDETDYLKGRNYFDNVRYPIPHCSCTGVRQQCYRWGNGGWQSSCCTTMISMYPLPMNPTKRGSRLAGRKMTAGAFEKLLEKLGSEGVNVNYPVDLKEHWAKHGTNRYVTLR